MKTGLLAAIYLFCSAFYQQDAPSVDVDEITYTVIRCEGDRKTSRVRVQLLLTNFSEYYSNASYAGPAFTEQGGKRHQPFGNKKVDLFGKSGVLEMKTDVPHKTIVMEVTDVSPGVKAFAAISLTRIEQPKSVIAIRNVPITWR